MWISKKEYEELNARVTDLSNRLRLSDDLANKLEEETKRLAELITEKVTDCQIGPWCKDCEHVGYDCCRGDVISTCKLGESTPTYLSVRGGQVIYCKKHLHETCPEFEMNRNAILQRHF